MARSYSATFPPEPPPELDEAASVAAADQAGFDRLTEMLSHWDRPHRPSLHWMLTFDDQPVLADLAGRCRSFLPSIGLDPIAPERLHLTVRRLGEEAAVDDDQRARAVEHVARACRQLRPFAVQVVPLAGSPGAVRFSVAPWSPLLRLYHAAAAAAGVPEEEPLRVFRPHIGLAYSNRPQPAAPIQHAVAHARSEAPVSIMIRHLALVHLQRGHHGYTWDVLTQIPLGPTR